VDADDRLLELAAHVVDGGVHLHNRGIHLLQQVSQFERLLTRKSGTRRRLGRRRRAGADGEERATHQPLGLDRRDGIGSHQLMQVFRHLHAHAELAGGLQLTAVFRVAGSRSA